MKKIFFLILVTINLLSFGQVIRYVDTEVILQKMPQYIEAKEKIDAQIKTWQTEIENSQKILEEEKKNFENEKILLTEDQIKDKKKDLDKKEKEIKENIELRFGSNGGMLKMKTSLVKPIQDQIFEAISKLSQKNKIDLVFDKNTDLTILFSNPKFDYTDEVMKELRIDDKSKKIDEKIEQKKSNEEKRESQKKASELRAEQRIKAAEAAREKRLKAAEDRKNARIKATEDARKAKEEKKEQLNNK